MARFNYNNKDSNEELYFEMWLNELVENGYIEKFIYQPDSFLLHESVKYDILIELKTKTKMEQRTLLQKHSYTPDYKIFWNKKAKGLFYQNIGEIKNKPPVIFAQDDISYIDIKGTYNQHNTWQSFEINRKIIWEKFGIFIDKIQPIGKKSCLFGLTFTPKKLPIWQKRDSTKLYAWAKKWKIKYLNDFVSNKQQLFSINNKI